MEDETMSQDAAFTTDDLKDETFKFDEEVKSDPASQAETDKPEETAPSVAEEVTVVDEQKVPYSRFQSVIRERDQSRQTIQDMEARLAELENKRYEPAKTSEGEPPVEWKELYGDSDAAKRAWKIQEAREAQIEERALRKALETIDRREVEEAQRLEDNEDTIDQNLEALQGTIGKKLTAKVEEELLSIVDEFSPVDASGKYITLFPFDKAYEIYEMRNAQKGAKTNRARENVARLANSSSEGEADESEAPYRRGWDNWREKI